MAAPMLNVEKMEKQSTIDDFINVFQLQQQLEWTSKQQITTVNEWLRNASSRWKGLYAMKMVLLQCDEDILGKYGLSWIEMTANIAVKNHLHTNLRSCSSQNFRLLLKLSSQIPSVSREINSAFVTNLLQQLLSSDTSDPKPCLNCLEALMDFFPGGCGTFKGKICKYLSVHLPSLNSTVQDAAIRCWSRLPMLGGGGVGRKNHVSQWEQQVEETLHNLDYVTSCLHCGLEDDKIDPSLSSLSLYLPPLPVEEPGLTCTLLQRFIILSKCVCGLLSLNFNLSVTVSIDKFLKVLTTNFDITTKKLSSSDSKNGLEGLHTLHISCLDMLKRFVISYHSQLSRHSALVNQMFLKLLSLWRDQFPKHGVNKTNTEVRLKIYDTMLHWVECCGQKGRFLCGKAHFTDGLLNHIIEDFNEIPESIQLKENIQQQKTQGNSKKKNKATSQSDVVFRKLVDSTANQQLCVSSLKVLRLKIYNSGSRMSADVHKKIQEVVILLLAKLMQGKSVIPYTESSDCRKELYHLLLALVMVPSPNFPAPLQLALRFFSHGVARDRSAEVRSFCVEANAIVSNLVRPRVPAMNRICPKIPCDLQLSAPKSDATSRSVSHVATETTGISFVDDEVFSSQPTVQYETEEIPDNEEPTSSDESPPSGEIVEEEENSGEQEETEEDSVLENMDESDAIVSDADDKIPKENQAESDESDNESREDRRAPKRKLPQQETEGDDFIEGPGLTKIREQECFGDELAAMLCDFVDASPDQDEMDGSAMTN